MESDNSDLTQDHQDCKTKLKKVRIYLNSISQRMERLFSFADLDKTKVNTMKKAFSDGNYKPLIDYTSQLKQFLEQSEVAYAKFARAYEDAELICNCTIDKCKRKKKEIVDTKRTIAAVGAGASIGVLAIGVMSANFALSMKKCKASSIVAAVLPSVGVVASWMIVTRVLKQKVKSMQWATESISNDVEHIHNQVMEAGTKVERVKEVLATIADDTTNADLCAKDRADPNQFGTVFDILLDGIKGARQDINLPCPITSDSNSEA